MILPDDRVKVVSESQHRHHTVCHRGLTGIVEWSNGRISRVRFDVNPRPDIPNYTAYIPNNCLEVAPR